MSKLHSTEEIISIKLEKPDKKILKGQKSISFTDILKHTEQILLHLRTTLQER
jgi:hypothetical protein